MFKPQLFCSCTPMGAIPKQARTPPPHPPSCSGTKYSAFVVVVVSVLVAMAHNLPPPPRHNPTPRPNFQMGTEGVSKRAPATVPFAAITSTHTSPVCGGVVV